MTRISIFLSAFKAALCQFFAPSRPIVGLSPNGHLLLKQWDHAPEELLVEYARNTVRKQQTKAGAFVLLGLDGESPKILTLPYGTARMATHGVCHYTLPTRKNNGALEIQVEHQGAVLSGCNQQKFSINGREVERAQLLDYDEVELFGYRYLCLDLMTSSQQLNSSLEGGAYA